MTNLMSKTVLKSLKVIEWYKGYFIISDYIFISNFPGHVSYLFFYCAFLAASMVLLIIYVFFVAICNVLVVDSLF